MNHWNCLTLHWLYTEPILLAQLYRLQTPRWLMSAEINPTWTKSTEQGQNDSGFYQSRLIKWFLLCIRRTFQKCLGVTWPAVFSAIPGISRGTDFHRTARNQQFLQLRSGKCVLQAYLKYCRKFVPRGTFQHSKVRNVVAKKPQTTKSS